jgi:hypothetical protein
MKLFKRNKGPDLPDPGRRSVLKIVATLGAGVVIENALDLLPDGDEVDDSNEILIDPNKFEAYIDRFYDTAKKLSEDEDRPIPYEVFLAVSMHESDSGTSELAEEANNYFGIIAKDDWDGAVYDKPTEEEIDTADLDKYKNQKGFKVLEGQNLPAGRSRVRYVRPFRKYDSPEKSFEDFANKLFFKEKDGSYRYKDVVDYLKSGGRDPYVVIDLMSDNDEPGELQYATGSEWNTGVKRYIDLIQDRTGDVSSGRPDSVENVDLPPKIEAINLEELDFSEFLEPREEDLRKIMLEAFDNISHERWSAYRYGGIKKQSEHTRKLTDLEYYQDAYGLGRQVGAAFVVWHLWANGVEDKGDRNSWPSGSSRKASLDDQIKSWYGRYQDGRASASCGYMLGSDGETWQLVENMFDRTWHVGTGIQDPDARISNPGVDNDNAVGIEVQADSIGNVSVDQFESLIYWTAIMLLESGIIKEGMTREEVNEAVESSVVGHGKNEGLEFGSKYTRPMIQALQQFMFMAI